MSRQLVAGALMAFIVIPAAASQPGEAQRRAVESSVVRGGQPTFRSGIDLVALTVTVTDERKEFVRGLTASDFAVFENGVRQPISYFAASEVPLDLALVVDSSASMEPHLGLVQRSAAGLVDALRPGDRAAVIEFRNTVRTMQAMTTELSAVRGAIAQITASGGTALHQALYVTLSEFAGGGRGEPLRRRAVVVLSDGKDTSSLVSADDVLDRARHAGVSVYVVALRTAFQEAEAGGKYSPLSFGLRQLAAETGGRAFFPTRPADIEQIYELIGAELSSQYALGYVPRGSQRRGEWRTVSVRVPGREGLEPRTRAGYFASASAATNRRSVGRGGAR